MKKSNAFLTVALIPFFCLFACLSEIGYSDPFATGEQSTNTVFYMLNVEADIPDVYIYVNGNFMGNNHLETHFRSGNYKVEIKAAGYEPYTETVVLNHSWTIRAKMKPLSVPLVE